MFAQIVCGLYFLHFRLRTRNGLFRNDYDENQSHRRIGSLSLVQPINTFQMSVSIRFDQWQATTSLRTKWRRQTCGLKMKFGVWKMKTAIFSWFILGMCSWIYISTCKWIISKFLFYTIGKLVTFKRNEILWFFIAFKSKNEQIVNFLQRIDICTRTSCFFFLFLFFFWPALPHPPPPAVQQSWSDTWTMRGLGLQPNSENPCPCPKRGRFCNTHHTQRLLDLWFNEEKA